MSRETRSGSEMPRTSGSPCDPDIVSEMMSARKFSSTRSSCSQMGRLGGKSSTIAGSAIGARALRRAAHLCFSFPTSTAGKSCRRNKYPYQRASHQYAGHLRRYELDLIGHLPGDLIIGDDPACDGRVRV